VSDLIDTTEMYLRTIFELEEEGIVPLRARIAERLGHSGPTVSQTVARMERAGLLVVSGDRHLELTSDGRSKATRVMRKHRLAERLLIDVIGLEWEYVHDEACRWEHVMSERVERKLLEILDHPTQSPYGNPIPGLEELGEVRASEDFRGGGLRSLTDVTTATAIRVVVRRIGEPAQAFPEVLESLRDAGLRPGSEVTVRRVGGDVVVDSGGAQVEVPSGVGEHVYVEVEQPIGSGPASASGAVAGR
jgi:DtxR family transcriptional regulator, Mn-dependent transcriptional regulator